MPTIIKSLFIALGLLTFGLGTLGIFLPVLPTTPLYLLAAFFFAKGSARFHARLLQTRFYRRYLASFAQSRAMTLKTKLTICLPATAMLLTAGYFSPPSQYVHMLIGTALLFKWYYFLFRIRTVPAGKTAAGKKPAAEGIDRRLFRLAGKAKRYVLLQVWWQWVGLGANAAVVFAVASFLGLVEKGSADAAALLRTLLGAGAGAAVRALSGALAARASARASSGIKLRLRQAIYGKLIALGPAYSEQTATASVLQAATEGVEQLETYFSKYLPQLGYCALAPLTLFLLLAPVSLPAAGVMLALTPLIPAFMLLIGRRAKRTAQRHWQAYTTLGDAFLENLQGMTTLKIYGADETRQSAMSREAERFRRSTMRVLNMQLNSVIIMDLVAFGGAALGVTLAVRGVLSGSLSLAGGLAVTLLCAEFFLPLRLLGSYFHVAMSGVAAAHSIFRLLDIKTEADGARLLPEGRMSVQFRDVTFAYERERPVLNGVGLTLAPGRLVSLAGVSGCGKSTVAALLSGRRRGYAGEISIGGEELRTVARASLQSRVTLVAHDGYVFAGTVAENLRLARPEADDAALGEALRQVRLEDFFASRQGLATPLAERGANLSGGQRQRLCIARALLQNSAVYIFDEATSNIDAESEAAIMAAVRRLARDKTVLLISHRLANLIRSDRIYLLSGGRIAETGSHEELMASRGLYARLYEEQRRLERRGKGAAS